MRTSKLCMYAHDYLADSGDTKLFSRIDEKSHLKEENVLLPGTQFGGDFLNLIKEDDFDFEMTEDKEEEFKI